MPFTEVVKTSVNNKFVNVVFRGYGTDAKMALQLALVVIWLTQIASKLASLLLTQQWLASLIIVRVTLQTPVKDRQQNSRYFGLVLSHGLVRHIGLTSLHVFPLDRIVQGKLLC